ncbi:MAG: hypothetical protein KF785_01805 [Gemmatimonadales bacterium]|nr:hypothetical protein [Gemmatimonadales bacterium]
MTASEPPSDPSPEPEASPVAAGRKRWPVVLAAVIVVPILLSIIYTGFVLTWSYSDGERSGQLYKFSRKGWLCKTWEGELNITPTAAAPTIWHFTVRDEAIVPEITAMIGRQVVLHYGEHRGVPTRCFGDTNFFVYGIRGVAGTPSDTVP